MRELVLRLSRDHVEDVLDRLLPIVPAGIHEIERGPEIELRMRGAVLPTVEEVVGAVGSWPYELAEREVSDDWRVRREAEYEADLIGGRLVIRPEWAPQPASDVIDIVLGEGAAFGAGSHPTTRTCLDLLLDIPARGTFADLGCGTGVLAILAARLGWEPVVAVDIRPEAVEAAEQNAVRNGVSLQTRLLDLQSQPPPAADGFAANIPAALHAAVAPALAHAPQVGLLSGFSPDDAPKVVDAYAARGLRVARAVETHGWMVVLLQQA